MAVSGGGEGYGTTATQGVISAAPGTARFDGVWLIGEAWGHQAASPNVGLTLDDRGLTVTGPAQGQSNTLPWTWVQRFRAGAPMTFPDGTPATVVEVGLIGRSITLLIPPAQLREAEIEELNRYVPPQVAVPPPPVPSSSPVTGDELRAASDKASHSDDGTKRDVATPKAKRSKEARGKIENRTFRLALLLGVLVVVALAGTVVVALHIRGNQNVNAGVVVPQSTPTTLPPAPSTLTGPPESAKPLSVAGEVNLAIRDLPAGWSKIKFVPFAAVPSAFANVKSAANKDLASCAGLPLSHVGVLTGGAQPGGPQVIPSPIFVLNSGLHPSAISVTSIVADAAVERSDLGALLRPGIAHCLDNYYDSSFSSEHISTPPTVNRFTVPAYQGEQVIGLDVHIGITSNGRQAVYDYDVVVIGAGRIEIALGAQQNDEPFPNATLDHVVETMEARAATVAGGH
ncbi:MAG: hypothetical protein ACLP6E_00320 [Acidimicrobiales bacterium]